MSDAHDTIAAIATGQGRAGVGIVRISGPGVPDLVPLICGQSLSARHAHYGPFLDLEGQPIDYGISLRFAAPDSFTGEHVLELHGHGGALVLDLLLRRVLTLGVRAAGPGEFTQRAFLNGKLDLAQAEAVADLIDASSQTAARAAVRSLDGEFSRTVEELVSRLIALRAWLEAAFDFSEDDIDFLADSDLEQRTASLIEAFDALLAQATQGQRLRDGITVVLAGAANAGKSSLLNALSQRDAAIVTDIPGTTRDVIREDIVLQGIPVHLVDTAGIRLTSEPIEREGIARTRRAIESADHVLLLVDSTATAHDDLALPAGVPLSIVRTKVDLLDTQSRRDAPLPWPSHSPSHSPSQWPSDWSRAVGVLDVSVLTGEGMDALEQHLLTIAGHDSAVESTFIARRRHLDALQQARTHVHAALEQLNTARLPELAAEELRLAQQALDRITGRFDTEDLLGEIFSTFCIGK